MPTTKIADTSLETFYNQHPDFDLVNFDFTNTSAVEALSQTFSGNGTTLNLLKEYQRLLRLRADADSAKALHDKGYASAYQIASKSEKLFIREVKDEIDSETARQIYQKAIDVKARVAHLWANIHNVVASPYFRSLRVNPVNNNIVEFFSNIPSYRDMFGSLDYYECEHCQSLLSPSAYFVDLMWLVDKYITEPNLSEIPEDFKLENRRPDLADIPLNCENTNDLVPFLQIVNDILKVKIEAEPDITDADRHFATAKYPFNLPFNLPLEQIRRYLEHLNADLAFIYQTFNAPEDAVGRESAGLSIEVRELISTSVTTPEGLKELYGLYETDSLSDLAERDKFLQQTGLSRQELVNLLYQNLSAEELSPPPVDEDEDPVESLACKFYINQVLSDGNYVDLIIPDPDNPDREELNNLNEATLDRINRFVRFAQILDWSFADLDWVLNSIGISESQDIDTEAINKIGQIKQLQEKTKLPLDVLCDFWYDMKTIGVGEGRTPEDLFDRIYNNPLILKGESAYHPIYDNNPLYQDTVITWSTDGETSDEQKFGRSRLAAALKLGKNELDDLREAIWGQDSEVELTVENLSQLFRATELLKLSGLKVRDYQLFLGFLSIEIDAAISPDDLFEIVSYAQWLKEAGLTVWELDYIVNGNEDSSVEIAFSDQNIRPLMESFWAMGLPVASDPSEAEKKALDEQLAIHFDIDTELFIGLAHWVAEATDTLNYRQLLYTSVAEEDADWQKIVTFLKAISRLLLLANKLGLTGRELYSIAQYKAAYNIGDLSQLTIANVRNLDEFKDLVGAFQDLEDELVGYFEAIANGELDTKTKKCAKLSEISGWKQEEIEALVDTNFGFEETVLDSVAGIVELKQCFDTIDAVGGNVSFMGKLRQLHDLPAEPEEPEPEALEEPDLNWNTYLDTARSVMHVVKAKYLGDRLLEVTSKLDGAIAEGQRDGMTEFLIWKLNHRWQQEDKNYELENWRSLSEYLLIDVEMTGCASTSYIKQATLSVQMYLQRCQLGLEPGVKQLEIGQAQWDVLMSYRLWEANRKIFLYPENYIEPELRIDKSDNFSQLEDELLQGEITQETVESAYRNYFNTFEELAKLQIVESCRYRIDDPISLDPLDTLYVFGKSATEPPTYYYRRCLYPTAEQPIWEYWQKIDLQINSEYISPVYAFKRLFLFWVEWTEIPQTTPENGDPEPSTITQATIKYSFLNSSHQWVQPQTLLKDIEVASEQKDQIVWQKAYALALPETGSELERILTMFGGLEKKSGSEDYQISDQGRSQLLTADLLQENKDLTLLTPDKGWVEQKIDGLSEARVNIAVATVGNLAIFAGGERGSNSSKSSVIDIYDNRSSSWSQKELCEARDDIAVAVVGNLAIFAGGFKDGSNPSAAVDIYDASTNRWIEQNPNRLCEARREIAVATVGNLAIFAGGSNDQNNSTVLAAVDIYDASTNTWSQETLIEARHDIAVATIGNLAIFAGGYISSAAVDIYDASTNQWLDQNPNGLSEARREIAVATIGNLAIFAGGVGDSFSKAVDIYDASTNRWAVDPEGLVEARNDIAVATIGNLAIFAGGFGWNTAYSSKAVDIYDASTGEWIERDSTKLIESRHDIAVATIGNLAIFAGGLIERSPFSAAVDIYDASTGEWEQDRDKLIEARSEIAVATIGNFAIFASGVNISDAIDIYNAGTNEWEPNPNKLIEARYNIAVATVGNLAIFAGGINPIASAAVDIFTDNIPFRGTIEKSENGTALTAITTDNVLHDNYMGDAPIEETPSEDSTPILDKLSQRHSATIIEYEPTRLVRIQ